MDIVDQGSAIFQLVEILHVELERLLSDYLPLINIKYRFYVNNPINN